MKIHTWVLCGMVVAGLGVAAVEAKSTPPPPCGALRDCAAPPGPTRPPCPLGSVFVPGSGCVSKPTPPPPR